MVLMLMLVLVLLLPQETMKMAPTHLEEKPLMKIPPTVMTTLQPPPKTTLQSIPLDTPLQLVPEMTCLLVPEMKIPLKKTTFLPRKGLPLRRTLLQNGPLLMTLRIKPMRKAIHTLNRMLTGLKLVYQELLKPLLQENNPPT